MLRDVQPLAACAHPLRALGSSTKPSIQAGTVGTELVVVEVAAAVAVAAVEAVPATVLEADNQRRADVGMDRMGTAVSELLEVFAVET